MPSCPSRCTQSWTLSAVNRRRLSVDCWQHCTSTVAKHSVRRGVKMTSGQRRWLTQNGKLTRHRRSLGRDWRRGVEQRKSRSKSRRHLAWQSASACPRWTTERTRPTGRTGTTTAEKLSERGRTKTYRSSIHFTIEITTNTNEHRTAATTAVAQQNASRSSNSAARRSATAHRSLQPASEAYI